MGVGPLRGHRLVARSIHVQPDVIAYIRWMTRTIPPAEALSMGVPRPQTPARPRYLVIACDLRLKRAAHQPTTAL